MRIGTMLEEHLRQRQQDGKTAPAVKVTTATLMLQTGYAHRGNPGSHQCAIRA